jgi:hypothetical protein
MRRRRYLVGVTALATALAGCGDSGDDTETTGGETTGESSGDGPTDTRTTDSTTTDGTQPSSDRSSPPSVVFSFDYTADGDGTGELTIYDASGETVRAASIVLRGDFDNVASGGTWLDYGGEASGTVDGDPAVTPGDSVTVPVESGYEMNVIWETGDASAILTSDKGSAA